jgi:hypothetical protein
MRQIILLTIVVLWTIPGWVTGEETTKGKGLNDPLLEKLVGDWNVERKFPSGRTATNVVHVEWALQHQFVELHYRDVVTPPAYEAIVLIGAESVGKRYICHWADTFGGDYSTDGFAPREEGSNAIEFKFVFHDGELTNRYAFDPKNGSWTSTIRQVEKGEWKLFCEDTFTPASRK